MRRQNLLYAILIAFTIINMTGCSIIGDIFQAGLWVGIIVVVVVVVLIIFIISKIRKRD
ncbi:MAG: phosphatidate cytidylyltransferase [Bacteroidetes bacterium]|nr:phosphatidate cytidylyltransferase [Bacteroidota bacterium]